MKRKCFCVKSNFTCVRNNKSLDFSGKKHFPLYGLILTCKLLSKGNSSKLKGIPWVIIYFWEFLKLKWQWDSYVQWSELNVERLFWGRTFERPWPLGDPLLSLLARDAPFLKLALFQLTFLLGRRFLHALLPKITQIIKYQIAENNLRKIFEPKIKLKFCEVVITR